MWVSKTESTGGRPIRVAPMQLAQRRPNHATGDACQRLPARASEQDQVMACWVALLRGINVGGHHRLPMNDLVACIEAAGCSDVHTYIQSGNAVFRHSGLQAAELSELIGETMLKAHGFKPRVLLLSVAEFEQVKAANPFPEAVDDPKTLHVAFLSEKAECPRFDEMRECAAESESFVLTDSAFYLHAPDGIGRSKLAAKVEQLLGVEATSRNWRTVSRLAELAKGVD